MTGESRFYEGMVALCARNIPGFEIRFKDEHFSQKLIGFILRWIIPFNRVYMTRYTTTMYPRVYFRSRKWLKENYLPAAKVLAHEYVHLWDEKNRGHLRYKLAYISPQVLGGLTLLAWFAFIWTPALWALLFSVFLLPLPALGRRNIERRGYLMSMAVNHWRYGSVRDRQVEWILKAFTGSNYYFMWPFKGWMRRLIWKDLQVVEDSSIFLHADGLPFFQVHEMMHKLGLLAA